MLSFPHHVDIPEPPLHPDLFINISPEERERERERNVSLPTVSRQNPRAVKPHNFRVDSGEQLVKNAGEFMELV